MSTFRTTLVPDDPIADTARAPFNATARAEADARSIASQAFLSECLVAGVIATYVRLDSSSDAVAKGDAVARSGATALTVTRGDAAALTAAGLPFGLVLRAAAPGSLVLVAFQGAVGPDVTGLVAGAAGPVRLTAGRPERVASYTSGDYPIGYVDDGGWLTLSPASTATALLVVTSVAALPDTIPLRGTGGELFGQWFSTSGGAGVGTAGLLRAVFNSTIIGTRKADLTADLALLATDGADGLTLGDATYSSSITLAQKTAGALTASFGGTAAHTFRRNHVAIFGAGVVDAGGGVDVINLHDASTAPTAGPVDGAIIYTEKGAIKNVTPNGTFTTISPTDTSGGTYKQIDQQNSVVATTTAVATLLLSITIPSTQMCVSFDVDIQGYHVDTAYWARRVVHARRIGAGVVSVQVDTPTGVADVDNFGGVVLAIAASGNAVEIKITGPAAPVSWFTDAWRIRFFKP